MNTQNTIEIPNYNVSLQPLFLPGNVATKLCATVRDDTGEALACVSDRYETVQNRDLVSAVNRGIGRLGLNPSKTSTFVERNGARFNQRFEFKDKVTEITKVGDLAGLSLTIKNSFDGCTGIRFEVGILRLVCLNGLVRSGAEFGLNQRHTGTEGFIQTVEDAVRNSVEQFDVIAQQFGALADRGVTQAQGKLILENFTARHILSNRVAEPIHGVWERPTHLADQPRNLWSLYNAATEVLTHQVEARSYGLAHATNRRISDALIGAAHNDAAFENLLALPS
jgi:hypothetical protein